MNIRKVMRKIPVVGPYFRRVYRKWVSPRKPFQGSEVYWDERYEAGRNSGAGSYSHLADFKAEILNAFVLEHGVSSVIEYGCGDGNQLGLAKYPSYTGFDVSPKAISICAEIFSGDETKTFKLMAEYGGESAELTLSLDVIYHLVEDEVFAAYMNRLFDSSTKFVAIYSSDYADGFSGTASHVRHRHFSQLVAANKVGWELIKHIPNRYPLNRDTGGGSFSDFYIYAKS